MAAPLTIRLHAGDNVVVARMDILAGTKVEGEVASATRVPPGHKILTRAIKKGEPLVMRYRIVLHDGKPDKALAERLAADYAMPPTVTQRREE